jgi:hypothetical protein
MHCPALLCFAHRYDAKSHELPAIIVIVNIMILTCSFARMNDRSGNAAILLRSTMIQLEHMHCHTNMKMDAPLEFVPSKWGLA